MTHAEADAEAAAIIADAMRWRYAIEVNGSGDTDICVTIATWSNERPHSIISGDRARSVVDAHMARAGFKVGS